MSVSKIGLSQINAFRLHPYSHRTSTKHLYVRIFKVMEVLLGSAYGNEFPYKEEI